MSLTIGSIGGVSSSVNAARHLKGPDTLRRPHATGALGDDAGQTHFILQVDLEPQKDSCVLAVLMSVFHHSLRFWLVEFQLRPLYFYPGGPVVCS